MTAKTGAPKKPRSQRKSKRIWCLVTNHQNMLYMLAAGMVMGPAGFRGKHYSDPLSVYPGWIPLFHGEKIPAGAFKRATSERKHLLPCIASFDLSGLKSVDSLKDSPFKMLFQNGKEKPKKEPPTKSKDGIAFLIRAPLPLNLLLSINFCSSEDKQAFESAANDVSNVNLSSHQIKVEKSLFSADTKIAWPAGQAQKPLIEDNSDIYPAFGQALGGVLAMLYHTANRNGLGLAAFQLVTGAELDKDNDLFQSDPILAELPNWISKGKMSERADPRAQLFWGVIQSLVKAQKGERPQAPMDVALAYLEKQLDQQPERGRLERLVADMRGSLGLGGGIITELFERCKGSLSRPLLLFCLREHCTDLLKFSHPLLNDAEFILAGILFGVRDSWLRLPNDLRNPALSAYVSFRMGNAEHHQKGTGLAMNAPPRPKPLRELFTSPSGEWGRREKDAAIELASKCNWNDCIQTCITLADGDLPESFERKGSQVVLSGRVTSTTEEVDEAKFLHRLGQWPPIPRQIETEVRQKLGSPREIEEQANENGPSCG